MHLLEAWTSLGPLHLARLLALPGAILVATLLPGRVPARGAALVGAAAVLFLGEMAVDWWIRAAWVLAWLAIAWQAGLQERADLLPRTTRRRGFEHRGFEAREEEAIDGAARPRGVLHFRRRGLAHGLKRPVLAGFFPVDA